jgi:hypothetical protein
MAKKLVMPYSFVSFTQLSTYDRCPKWYKSHYFEKVKKPSSEAMEFGSLLHEAVKKVNQLLVKYKNKTEIDAEEVKKIYETEFSRRHFDFGTYQRGLNCILDYSEKTFRSLADIFKLEYEVNLKLKDDAGNETELKGIIDRIDNREGGLEIIDFKSGALMPSRDEVDDNLQLNIYAYILSKRFPGYKIWTSIYSLGAGVKVSVEKDISKLDAVEDYVVGLWQKIGRDKKFEPKLNKYCFGCPVKCHLYEELLTTTFQGKGIEKLEEVVKELEVVKTNLAILQKEKELLSGRIKQEIDKKMGEPLEVGGWRFELVNRHRASYVVPESDFQELRAKKLEVKNGKSEKK